MAKCFFPSRLSGLIAGMGLLPLYGTTTAVPTPDNVRYVGATTCQSSYCHGGAAPSRCQFTIWSQEDFHSRAYATLITARSARIAEALNLSMPASESNRCTTCHAPFADLPPAELASTAKITEGVSCESCHNGAGAWLRGHTRPDWTYADRVHAGMRDLRSAFVRASTCVACHQVIAPDIVKAGHPELIFELDGQDASEPRHWREKDAWFGPKAWLVGQAVALREISGQIKEPADPDLQAQERALVWLLKSVPGVDTTPISADQYPTVAAWSNQLAQTISGWDWKPETSTAALGALASTSSSFLDNGVPLPERELRAERLVLALDRLYKSLHPGPSSTGQADLAALFDAVQDRGQFQPRDFSARLSQFAASVLPKN